MQEGIEIHGFCDEQFEPLREVFAQNFEEDLEVGASLAATVNGKFVVDVWAGFADAARTRPWEEDTIVNVYSTTKFMTIICTLMCVDRGLLDLEAPAAKYWPEFAQAGKQKIPVKHILSHMSGISGFEKRITPKTLYDWDNIVDLLAAQEPWWEPGTKCGYHAVTHGYLLGELVRRVTGKSLGTFFREEVAIPLKADFHIGLSEEHDSRVGELIPPQMDMEAWTGIDPNSVAMKTLTNPMLTAKEPTTREWRAAEIPAAGGIGNARSVARIAAVLACGGELDGVYLLSKNTIDNALEEQIYDTDLVLQYPVRYGLGFGLNSQQVPLGPNPRTFYWGGWGGSLVAVDPDRHTSIGYVMNKMVAEPGVPTDPRTQRLGETFIDIVESL
ncbi:MAG: serine hydrolase domain-containing protein [Candidatus Thorarchaeota archaeon]